MILSSGLSSIGTSAGTSAGTLAGAGLGLLPLLLALGSLLAYTAAAMPAGEGARTRLAVAAPALVLGWVLHAALLVLDIGGWGMSAAGARLGFGPVLSLTLWLVIAVHIVESRFVPLPSVRRALAVGGAIVVVLAFVFPGEVRGMSSPWAPLHWVLGVASYGLFGAAVLHATLLDSAERQLRRHTAAAAAVAGPLGMPLLRLERLTFRFVEAGFVVLTLALVLGFVSAHGWRFDHKTVFSLLGWAVFAALIGGRLLRGWRGRRATRWLYAGTVLLLLGYAGSRFVFEVVLGRPAS